MKQFLWALCCLLFANTAAAEIAKGPVTNLPIPRFVSLKASEGNMRRGPSLTHRIDWVLTRRNMPLQVIAEHGHWRKVMDMHGAGGWVHYALLSGTRTVVIMPDLLEVYAKPDRRSEVRARFEGGVVARLGECNLYWCRLSAEGYKGWAPKTDVWGVYPDEIRD